MAYSPTETAERIGLRLLHTAHWNGPECTWTVATPDLSVPARQRKTKQVAAGGAIYQGTAGIALFLSELYGVLGEKSVRQAARGALCHAHHHAHQMSAAAFGFHSGRVGVAWAMARYAAVTAENEHLHLARELLLPLFGNESRDMGRDVIGGGAGAIPVLLYLAEVLELPQARQSAIALAENIQRSARRNIVGWSWPSTAIRAAKDLTGFAHGAAGYGAGLLELYATTGEAWCRFAAEQAFAYEDAEFDVRESNWPDFRYRDMVDNYTGNSLTDQFRNRIRSGEPIPRYVPTGMHAWCHGSPGIGLSRLRAFELLGDVRYRNSARTAVTATARAIRCESDNYSLCHGASGNCETLMFASSVLGEGTWIEQARAVAAEGIARYESADRPWPTGAVGGVPDSSLLLGEAGIGHFLLRLEHQQIPSVLIRTSPAEIPAPRPYASVLAGADVEQLRREHVNAFFGRSIRLFQALDPQRGDLMGQLLLGREDADIPAAHRKLHSMKDSVETSAARALFEDALRLDDVHLARTAALNDAFHVQLTKMLREPDTFVDWQHSMFSLDDSVALVTMHYAWDDWSGESAANVPEADPYAETFILDEYEGSIRTRRLGTMAAMVLTAIQTPRTLEELVELVAPLLLERGLKTATVELTSIVHECLRTAYRDGAIQALGIPDRSMTDAGTTSA